MKIILIILLAVLLVSCGERQRKPQVEWESEDIQENRYSTMKQDSTIPSSAKDASPSTATPSAPSRPVRSSSKSSDSYDNMRGFDPASEDDIDDNGMSRYMENNDDEGWD
jgi:hypothetical protein